MQDKWTLPDDRPKEKKTTEISQQLEAVGSHFGQLGDDLGTYGDSIGTLEEQRQKYMDNHAYFERQARRLGGGGGATPNTALIVQAGTQLASLIIQSLWIRVFSVELDAITMTQIVILINFFVGLAVSFYLNKVAGR